MNVKLNSEVEMDKKEIEEGLGRTINWEKFDERSGFKDEFYDILMYRIGLVIEDEGITGDDFENDSTFHYVIDRAYDAAVFDFKKEYGEIDW